MNQPRLVCLSLTPNLRCVGFTVGQFTALIIPPATEVILSSLFIYLYSGPDRRIQTLLAADSVLYYIWALLDVLSHVVPAVRTSLSLFRALDYLVGAVSFTPILVYSIYLYRLSLRDFIPFLPRKFQPYLEISLPISWVIAMAVNEVSSFVGAHIVKSPNSSPVVMFFNNNESLWLSLSRLSLTVYTVVQFLFFLLASFRLFRALLDQRWTELTRSDEHYYLHGTIWITAGIFIGAAETVVGFAQVGFGVALARRILRLLARVTLMLGLLKGLDSAESFENPTGGQRAMSRIGTRISRMLGVNTRQTGVFRRIPQSYSEQSTTDEHSSAEKQPNERRVTVHRERGQAPFLQIRFSAFDFPTQAILADTVQQKRTSISGLIPGRANAGNRTQQYREDVSGEMSATRDAIIGVPRAKSALVANDSHASLDWIWPPERNHSRKESGGTISDNLSVVRDLECKFPNLPPRVTGKYRGSILGRNYEEDPFPVVGVSRQSSLRRGNPSEEVGTSVTLSPSNSIKRKPAPPLLDDIVNISNRRNRRVSTWGGLTESTTKHYVEPPVVTNSPTVHDPGPTRQGGPITLGSRSATAHDLIQRASKALSDASIHSAEWLASAKSPQSTGAPFTAADIEMYRSGNLGPGSIRPVGVGEAPLSVDNLIREASNGSTDSVERHPKPS